MRKNFVKLLGAEYDLLQKSGSKVLTRFYIAAIGIVMALFVSFGSISYAIDLLFHSHIVEILLSIFFVFLFACIYIFLINTFAKEGQLGQNRFFNASNLIRMAFVVFIALVVALPLTIYVCEDDLGPKTERHKLEVLEDHTKRISAGFQSELQALQKREEYCQSQKKLYNTDYFNEEILRIETETENIKGKTDKLIGEAERKIAGNSFFLYQIRQVHHYLKAWLLILFIVTLFFLPGYLVFTISSDNAYYRLKKISENDIAIQAYETFVIKYRKIFNEKYGLTVEIFSRYEDPPFKRIRKSIPEPGTAEEFLKKYITVSTEHGL